MGLFLAVLISLTGTAWAQDSGKVLGSTESERTKGSETFCKEMGSAARRQTNAFEKRCEALGSTLPATTSEHETTDEDLEKDDAGTAPAGPKKIQQLP